MKRRASILSPVRNSRASDVWIETPGEGNEQLRPSVRDQILGRLSEALDEYRNNVLDVWLIGSITGYQYDEDADLDINVLLDIDEILAGSPQPEEELRAEIRNRFRSVNGENLPDTEHPINYFLNVDNGYPMADGIYDVLDDMWIKEPGKDLPPDYDPALAYEEAIERGEDIAKQVDEWYGIMVRARRMMDYPQSGTRWETIYKRHAKKIADLLFNIVDERHEAFDLAKRDSLDSANESPANITYKYLERSGTLDRMHRAHDIAEGKTAGRRRKKKKRKKKLRRPNNYGDFGPAAHAIPMIEAKRMEVHAKVQYSMLCKTAAVDISPWANGNEPEEPEEQLGWQSMRNRLLQMAENTDNFETLGEEIEQLLTTTPGDAESDIDKGRLRALNEAKDFVDKQSSDDRTFDHERPPEPSAPGEGVAPRRDMSNDPPPSPGGRQPGEGGMGIRQGTKAMLRRMAVTKDLYDKVVGAWTRSAQETPPPYDRRALHDLAHYVRLHGSPVNWDLFKQDTTANNEQANRLLELLTEAGIARLNDTGEYKIQLPELERMERRNEAKVAAEEDVEQKAQDIFSRGGVEFVSVTTSPEMNRAVWEFNVRSTSGNTYPVYGDTSLDNPTQFVDKRDTYCGCDWDKWNYDRAPEYKHLEHRYCSHATAVQHWLEDNGPEALQEEQRKEEGAQPQRGVTPAAPAETTPAPAPPASTPAVAPAAERANQAPPAPQQQQQPERPGDMEQVPGPTPRQQPDQEQSPEMQQEGPPTPEEQQQQEQAPEEPERIPYEERDLAEESEEDEIDHDEMTLLRPRAAGLDDWWKVAAPYRDEYDRIWFENEPGVTGDYKLWIDPGGALYKWTASAHGGTNDVTDHHGHAVVGIDTPGISLNEMPMDERIDLTSDETSGAETRNKYLRQGWVMGDVIPSQKKWYQGEKLPQYHSPMLQVIANVEPNSSQLDVILQLAKENIRNGMSSTEFVLSTPTAEVGFQDMETAIDFLEEARKDGLKKTWDAWNDVQYIDEDDLDWDWNPSAEDLEEEWQSKEEVKMAAARSGMGGAIVALVPSEELKSQLTVPGGLPAEDLHVTLAPVGRRKDVDKELFWNTVREWAKDQPQLEGKVEEYDQFDTQDGYALYASVYIPGAEEMRDSLFEALEAAGIYPNNDFGFVPHMTLDYADEPFDTDKPLEADTENDYPFELVVTYGDERETIPLRKTAAEETETLYRAMVFPPGEEITDLSQVLGREGVGVHWTDDFNIARAFASSAENYEVDWAQGRNPGEWWNWDAWNDRRSVVLEAVVPKSAIVQDWRTMPNEYDMTDAWNAGELGADEWWTTVDRPIADNWEHLGKIDPAEAEAAGYSRPNVSVEFAIPQEWQDVYFEHHGYEPEFKETEQFTYGSQEAEVNLTPGSPITITKIHYLDNSGDMFSSSKAVGERVVNMQTTAEARSDQDGCMVALVPSKRVREKAYVPGGEEPDNMHITLCVFDNAPNEEFLINFVKEWAKDKEAPQGVVSGYGTFSNEDNNVLYAGWDIPHIDDLRSELTQLLEAELEDDAVDFDEEHGFTPHMTLDYQNEPFQEIPVLDDDMQRPETLKLIVAFGDKWHNIPWGNTSEKVMGVWK